VVRTSDPRAANVWFLRGYIAWKRQNFRRAPEILTAARSARGRDWKPAGAALEDDVQHRMHNESGFLNVFERPMGWFPGTRAFLRSTGSIPAPLPVRNGIEPVDDGGAALGRMRV
jgi:hypothetical protein